MSIPSSPSSDGMASQGDLVSLDSDIFLSSERMASFSFIDRFCRVAPLDIFSKADLADPLSLLFGKVLRAFSTNALRKGL